MTKHVDMSEPNQRLREVAMDMHVPELAADAFERIRTRRALGERIALPTSDAALARPARNILVASLILTAAAAAVMLAMALPGGQDTPVSDLPPSNRFALDPAEASCADFPLGNTSNSFQHLMVSAFGVAVACGAEPASALPISIDAAQIPTGTFVYRGVSITDGAFTSVQQQSTYHVSRMTWHGVPAILATRDGPLITRVSIDSLTVATSDLTPLRWASRYPTQHPAGALHANFDSASVTMVMSGRIDTSGTFPFARIDGRVPLEFVRPLIVPALPLHEGWRGTVPILPPIHPRLHAMYGRTRETMPLRVVGREQVTVPAGTFDCWKLESGTAELTSFIWVSSARHFVVRTQSRHKFGDTQFDDRSELQLLKLDSI